MTTQNIICTESEYYQEFRKRNHTSIHDMAKDLGARMQLVHKYAFAVLTNENVERILEFSRNILSIGAGNGYNEMLLFRAGADIIATDPKGGARDNFGFLENEWCVIEEMDHTDAMKAYPDRTIFLCWPYMSAMAWDMTKMMKSGQKLIYIGERYGGCTASDEFFDELEENFELEQIVYIPQWQYIRDDMRFFTKK